MLRANVAIKSQFKLFCHARQPIKEEGSRGMQDALELVATLTPREREVLVALWENRGCRAGELAKILCVSEACIRFHLHNIYQKLNVSGKVELLLLCNEIGFDQLAATLSGFQE